MVPPVVNGLTFADRFDRPVRRSRDNRSFEDGGDIAELIAVVVPKVFVRGEAQRESLKAPKTSHASATTLAGHSVVIDLAGNRMN